MTEIVRGDGMKYALAYNAYHNLESIGVDGKDEKLVKYTYKTGNGRLKEIAYANGDKMKATYNGVGQMVAEKWYNSLDELTAHYKYVYDGQGNIVRSIDILGQKEYNYEYDAGKVVRATESDIVLSDEMVVSKSLVNTVKYYYDADDKMTKKAITPASGSVQTIYYENSEDNTVVKFNAGGKTITAHSKTDSFGRKVFDELQLGTDFVSRQFVYHAGKVTDEHKEMAKVKSSATTQLVSQIILSNGTTLSYGYDAEERITSVVEAYEIDGVPVTNTTLYTYDALGQLLTETVNGTVVNTMTYDNYGNIVSKNGVAYTYGDEHWHDLLTAYDGQSIVYDKQGNPTNYLGHTLTWEKGRQLKKFVKADETEIEYTYNANGIRTGKKVDGVLHTYTLDGTKILREIWGNNTLIPLYDNEDGVCGILYNNVPYYFIKNLQGDVIAIVDKEAKTVARYSYDAWGVCTVTQDSSNCQIATINPYRYRGYYFDEEIELYYLQSRYFDAGVGRFINVDEACCIDSFGSLFAYCYNTPVTRVDEEGYASTYSGIVGFGIQVAITASVLYHQGFTGFEAIWFNKNNNFGNGFIPWCYWYYGGSLGFTLDFKQLLSPNLLNNPKNVLKGFGLYFSCSVSITCFLVTANRMRDPYDYTGGFSFWTGTVWGVTVSKAWSARMSTYGVGVTWEVGIKKWSISLGKKLFGTTSGYSNYKMLSIGTNAKSLYNCVKGRV